MTAGTVSPVFRDDDALGDWLSHGSAPSRAQVAR